MSQELNPYSPSQRQTSNTNHWRGVMLVFPLLGFGYPVWAISLVGLTWFLDRVIGMRGAILHSYDTPLGLVFNVAAVLVTGWMIWLPVGFVCSTLIGPISDRPALTLTLPVTYIVMSFLAIMFVVLDPTGLFEYFFD